MSTADPGDDPDLALAGEYVLRLLGPEEAAACATREAQEPAFAALVAAWRADFAAFDAVYAAEAPRPAVERRIMARLFGAEPSRLARLWQSAGLWRAAAAVAVMVALVLAWPGLLPPPGTPPARLASALAPMEGSGFAFLAVYEPEAGMLMVSRTDGAPAAGRSLQLWLVEAAGPMSLGLLPEAAVARMPLPGAAAALMEPGVMLAVSDEPAGGSPAPTRVVAMGEAAEI